jgi:hypothetical protein
MCRQSASICLIKSPTRQHRLIGPLALRLQTLADPGRLQVPGPCGWPDGDRLGCKAGQARAS